MKYLLVLLLVSACGQGPTGNTGSQGPIGQPGSSCAVEPLQPNADAPCGGAIIECSDGTYQYILNGVGKHGECPNSSPKYR